MSTFEHPDPAVVAENLLTLQNQVKSLAEEAGRSNVVSLGCVISSSCAPLATLALEW